MGNVEIKHFDYNNHELIERKSGFYWVTKFRILNRREERNECKVDVEISPLNSDMNEEHIGVYVIQEKSNFKEDEDRPTYTSERYVISYENIWRKVYYVYKTLY